MDKARKDIMRGKVITGAFLAAVLTAALPAASAAAREVADLVHSKGSGYKTFAKGWHSLVMPERDIVAHPEKAIKLIGVRKGDIVADIDPGPGYWTFKLARAVGPSGRVLGVQVYSHDNVVMNEWRAAAALDRKMNPYDNVQFLKSPQTDIGLPPESVDIVFLSLCAISISDPFISPNNKKLLESFRRALKPGGKLVVIDILYTPVIDELSGADSFDVFLMAPNEEVVIKNYGDCGFKLVGDYDIYRGILHALSVKFVQATGNYKKLTWREKVTFTCEMFFLVFEKSGA